MAATSNSTLFDVDSFANGLISDLGYVLALFGDLPTKQFLAISLGWSDNIILAVGPIGILTIVVSAIRVAGGRWLRAVIGRWEFPLSSLGRRVQTPSAVYIEEHTLTLLSSLEVERAEQRQRLKSCPRPQMRFARFGAKHRLSEQLANLR